MKRVHLVTEKTLRNYVKDNAVLRSAERHFLERLKEARWNEPADIKKDFSAADLLGNGSMRVIFDLGGNRCRMICKYHFGHKEVSLYVCWLGMHKEYDELRRKGLQYSVLNY